MKQRDTNAALYECFKALFRKDGADLRTTEVAKILGVHRVTISRFKHHGFENCEPETLNRLLILLRVSNKAMRAGELPLKDKDIKGKNARLIALKQLIRRHYKQ